MHYFLDFDRTIFDTPAFKKTLAERPTLLELWRQLLEVFQEVGNPESIHRKRDIFGKSVGAFLSNGRFLFNPEELKNYLYPDVPEFLREHGQNVTIVTYGVQAFIMAKVTSALTHFPVHAVVYTARHKGRTLRRLCAQAPGPYTYVDDAHFQLRSVARVCPQITIYEMRRDELAPDGHWPMLHSLDELPKT